MVWMILHLVEHGKKLENTESLNCCDTDSDEFDYDFDIESVLHDLVQVTDLFDELKMIVMSLCEPDGGDWTGSLQDSIDPNGEIEITVINIGNDASNWNQLACLVNNADNLREEICERPNTKSNT